MFAYIQQTFANKSSNDARERREILPILAAPFRRMSERYLRRELVSQEPRSEAIGSMLHAGLSHPGWPLLRELRSNMGVLYGEQGRNCVWFNELRGA